MSSFIAVVLLTYRESLRKKILVVFLIFCLGLIISSAFFPVVSASDRIKLVETWTFQTVTFFGVLIAVFLAAVSIPADIESKRLFMVLTKPISKETVLFGRLVGFILTTAFIILIMGIAGMLYIRTVSLFSLSQTATASVVSEAASSEQGILGVKYRIKAAEFFFQQMPVDGKTGPKSGTSGYLNGLFSKTKDAGLEVSLSGYLSNQAGWKFKDLYNYRLSDKKVKAEIKLKASEGMGVISTKIAVRVINPTTKQEKTQKLNVAFKKTAVIEFDRELIDRIGEVHIYISRLNPESSITVNPETVILLSAPVSYEWNFLKALGIIFLQIVLVLVFCVTCSSFLSGPVNIFLNIFLYFCGSGMQYLQSSLETMKITMLQEIKREQISELAKQVQPFSEPAVPLWMMNISDTVLNVFLSIVPDFSRFDAWNKIMKGHAVNISDYNALLGYVFIYAIIMLAFGIIAFRLRDAK